MISRRANEITIYSFHLYYFCKYIVLSHIIISNCFSSFFFFSLSLSFLALKAYIRTSITCYTNYFDLIYLCVIADTAALAGTTTLTGKFQFL